MRSPVQQALISATFHNSGVQIDNRYLLVDGLELKPQIAGFFFGKFNDF